MEPGNDWGRGDGYSNVMALVELARKPDGSEWTAERRERILQQVLARVERDRARWRWAQAFAAGASAVLAVGLLVKLMTG